jgi:hypothetical protein
MRRMFRSMGAWLGLVDVDTTTCSDCGHLGSAHLHYRGGSDCAECRCVMLLAPAGNPSVDLKTSEKILGR